MVMVTQRPTITNGNCINDVTQLMSDEDWREGVARETTVTAISMTPALSWSNPPNMFLFMCFVFP